MELPKFFTSEFDQIIVWDFEFANIGGEIIPTSLAYKNILKPDEKIKFLWLRNPDGTRKKVNNPFPQDQDILFVSYFGEAEWSCFIEMGWKSKPPGWRSHMDLFSEIKILKNGLWAAFGLSDVAEKLGFDAKYLDDDKTNLRERLGNNLVGEDEYQNVARYNKLDVEVTEQLFFYIVHHFQEQGFGAEDWLNVTKRGWITRKAAFISRRGYPIDVESWNKFIQNFDKVMDKVMERAHKITGCFPMLKGVRKFDHKAFRLLVDNKLRIDNWPTSPVGAYKIDRDTLRRFERYAEIKTIKEALNLRNSTKLKDLPIDPRDDRAKTYCSYFGAKTGRATPSTSRHIPNMPPCFTPFMVPRYKKPILKVDYEQQEFIIAAVLSGDKEMIKAYESGDPYLALGKAALVIPEAANKDHPKRQMYKTICFMTQYGAGVKAMAADMNEPIEVAEKALQDHQRTFKDFWKWQQEYLDQFMFAGKQSVWNGWTLRIPEGSTFRKFGETKGYSENTLKNFPVQATGAAILYEAINMASKFATIIGTMHDEIIFELDEDWNDQEDGVSNVTQIAAIQNAMEEASEKVLGYRIRTSYTIHYSTHRMMPKDPKDYELFKFICEECGIGEGHPSIEEYDKILTEAEDEE